MRVIDLRVATRKAEQLRAQYLIVEIYNQQYGIVFSNDIVDLESRIEPYPDAYLIGTVDGEVVAACGLYVGNTYVERYGDISKDRIQQEVDAAGVERVYDVERTVEITKLVTRADFGGRGVGRQLLRAAHSAAFAMAGDGEPPLILCCAKQSIYRTMYEPSGIRTRRMEPFPEYPVHERYRSPDNPMDSRLIIPTLDLPPEVWGQVLPCQIPVEDR